MWQEAGPTASTRGAALKRGGRAPPMPQTNSARREALSRKDAQEMGLRAERLPDVESVAVKRAIGAMIALGQPLPQFGIEPALLELVKIRASQINGCAYCLDIHIREARAVGETVQRIDTLAAWRETPFYTPAERAALALAECLQYKAEVVLGHSPVQRNALASAF